MPNFMIYTRDDSGTITRTHRRASLTAGDVSVYQHAERLTGWPESEVFWSRDVGICNGIAPLSRAASAVIASTREG